MNQSLIVYNLTLVMPAKITFPNSLESYFMATKSDEHRKEVPISCGHDFVRVNVLSQCSPYNGENDLYTNNQLLLQMR